MSDSPITPTPAQPTAPSTATVAPAAKKSGKWKFKLSLAALIILMGAGGAGYIAYRHGLANPYLPTFLQKHGNDAMSTNAAAPASSSNPSIELNNSANNAPTMTPNPPAASSSPDPEVANSTGMASTSSAASSNNPVPNQPSTTVVSSNNPANLTTINNLMGVMSAQMQWQSLQFDFAQRWDTAGALQQIQTLKNQLQSINNSALLPTLTALSQTEAQVQAWHALNPQGQLSALQQSITDLDKLNIRTTDTGNASASEPSGWWRRFVFTLKKMFEVKRVDSTQPKALPSAEAAIVKQGIGAHLMSAQWLARSGQWAQAQAQIRMAQEHIQHYGQGYTLDALKPLMDTGSFPTPPDFSVVQQALTQAHAQLTAQFQGEAAHPGTTMPVTPAPSNNTHAPKKGDAP